MTRHSWLAILTLGALVSGCQTASPQLQTYRSLSGQAQLEHARSLAIQDRLDLYHAQYRVKRHPRDSSLSIAFVDAGLAGFDATMARIDSRSAFNEYVWVLKAIDAGEEIDLCQPTYRDAILRRATAVGLRGSDLTYITFEGCSLHDGERG